MKLTELHCLNMTKEPLVSIIIPYFNAGETIHETMESVFAQSYQNYDVWIINDGSTDPSSLEALKQYGNDPRVTILHQENAGPSVARNYAIEKSLAEFIVPLDADDLIELNTIPEALEVFSKDHNIGVVYGDIQYFGERSDLRIQETFDIKKQLVYNQIAMCSVIKIEVFNDIGFFDVELSKPGLEDWEFFIRAGASNWKLEHVTSVHFKVRSDKESRTYQVANSNIDSIRSYIYKKHSDLIFKEYLKLFYYKKMLLETPDYRLGKLFLSPYRLIKSIFN